MLKRVSATILIKLLSAVIALLSVPILLSILSVEGYGVWAALTSVIGWITLFDFGMGYAIKNTVSRGLANNDYSPAKNEVIQTFRFMVIVCIFILCLFVVGLNTISVLQENKLVSCILILPVIVIFPLTLGAMILQGANKFILQSLIMVCPPLVFIAYLLVIGFLDIRANMAEVAVVFVTLNIIAIFSVWQFSSKIIGLSVIRDMKKLFTGSIFFSRLKVGIRFFILQLSSLILYSVGTMLTIENTNSETAAYYDVVNKVYMFGLTLFNVGIAVFWTEISVSLERKDFMKIKRLYLLNVLLTAAFILGCFIFSFMAPYFIDLWTRGKVIVDVDSTFIFCALVSAQAFAYAGAVFLNAFERISVQMAISVFSLFAMFPLSQLFFNNDYGMVSVPIAAFILTIPSVFYCNFHAVYLIKGGLSDAKNS